jgi:hypothetical protein
LEAIPRARGLAAGTLAGVVLLTSSAAAPPPVEAATPADRVIAIAKAQLGDPWAYGATGPSRFDCSGLVIYSFQQAGYGARIWNGRYRIAYALYSWFRGRGLATRSNPQRGDLVVWGGGSHIGIYIGSGMAISTLRSGVRIHGVHAVSASFTAYLRTGMSSGTVSTAATTTTTSSGTYRYATAAVRMRSGPSTSYATLDIAPAGDKLLATRSARDSMGRVWYNVWSASQRRSGWVAGWYTRPA